MPRKKEKDKDLLNYEIKTRVNEKRYNTLLDLLTRSTHQNMSELVRDILENKPVTIRIYDESFDDFMEQIILIKKEINAIGVNINQVTHFFNGSSQEIRKPYYALKIAEQYNLVGHKVDQLLKIIAFLSSKWLQK
jgi:hypothetical protein